MLGVMPSQQNICYQVVHLLFIQAKRQEIK